MWAGQPGRPAAEGMFLFRGRACSGGPAVQEERAERSTGQGTDKIRGQVEEFGLAAYEVLEHLDQSTVGHAGGDRDQEGLLSALGRDGPKKKKAQDEVSDEVPDLVGVGELGHRPRHLGEHRQHQDPRCHRSAQDPADSFSQHGREYSGIRLCSQSMNCYTL